MPTADEVDVILTVSDAAYLQRLKQDEAVFLRTMKSLEQGALSSGRAMSIAGNQAVASADRMVTAFRGVDGQVANLGAQFQDIGVQLAGGQSPFLIAIQQGTQISAALGQAGAGGAVAALKGAFASLINPIGLATIGIIALGGYAIQYFGTLIAEGSTSNEKIKEQNDLIRDVAERWGEATPALKAYIDELDKVADQKETGDAFDTAVKRQFEDLKAILPDLRISLAEVRQDISALGGSESEVSALQSAFNDLESKVRDGSATAADLDRVLALLANTTGSQTTPSMINFSSVLSGVAQGLAAAAKQAAILRAEQEALAQQGPQQLTPRQTSDRTNFIAEQDRINTLTTEQLNLEREIARVKSEAGRDDIALTDSEATRLAKERIDAEARRAKIIKDNNEAAKAGASSVKDIEKERDAVIALIERLEYEQSLIGATNEQKAVQNALRQVGAAATDLEREQITGLVEENYRLTESYRAQEQAVKAVQSEASSLLSGYLRDIKNGVDGAEALSRVFDKLADKLIDIAAQNLVAAAFGGLGGGGGGGLFSFIGSLFGGRRATGGNVRPGMAYAVGERGPEAFVPNVGGTIVPASALGGGSSQSPTRIVLEVQEGAAFTTRILEVAGPQSVEITRAGVESYNSVSPAVRAEQNMRFG